MLDRGVLENSIKTKNIPGTSIAIKNEGNVESYPVGIIDVTNPQPVTDQTIFEAASLSKPVFAYIVLKQVEKGLFSKYGEPPESGLDRPLREICEFGPPNMRNDPNYQKLTVRMLLSHQARLPNEFASSKDEKYIASENTRGFDYSGEAYRFLNEVLEHVTGKNLWDLSKETFIALEMNHTRFLPDPSNFQVAKEERAVGHDINGKRDETDHFRPLTRPHPAASLITTAEDYLKFLDQITNDEFVKKWMLDKPVPLETMDKKAIDSGVSISTLHDLSWGNGIGIQKTKEGTILFHWGDINTNRSFFAVNLDTNKAVVCLTNSANGPAIFSEITRIVGNLTPALIWLKIREKQPIKLKESKKSIEQSSITTQSFFSQTQESSKNDKQEEKTWVYRKKGG